MGLRNKKSIFLAMLANISRVVLALVLVLSGFVKAVDPKGTMYKLQEYADAFYIDTFSSDWLLFFAIMLAAVEFLVGVFLLMGVYRRTMTAAVLAIFTLFTPFTLYLAIASPVEDCGCFGDAVEMPNWVTFLKNLFLLALSVIVFTGRKRFVRNVSVRNRWMVVLFSIFYVAFLEGVSLSYIPVVDFRPYAVGNNLRELTRSTADEYRTVMTFEKDGRTETFLSDSLPDETWTFVESRSELVSKGERARLSDFSIVDWENDYDIAGEVLADTGYVCIVVSELLEEASVGRVDKINDLYDYCLEDSLPFYAVTASDEDDIQLWRKRTGAEYPIYWADNMMLRTMVRANPGLVLLKDGVIVGKWNVESMPDAVQMMAPQDETQESVTGLAGMRGMRFWMILLVVPLLFIVLLDLLTGRRRPAAKPAGCEDDKTAE